MKQAWLFTEEELKEELILNGLGFNSFGNEDFDEEWISQGLVKIDENTTIAIEIANSQAVCFTVNDFQNETKYILTEKGLTTNTDNKNGFVDIIETYFLKNDIVNLSDCFQEKIIIESEDNKVWHIVYSDDMCETLSIARIYKK